MYNYKVYLQKQRETQDNKKNERQQKQIEQLRKQKSRKLVAKHDKRVEDTILQLIQNPQKIKVYTNNEYRPREDDKTRRLTERGMIFGYDNQNTRINKSVNRNSKLDLIPFTNSFNHHFRNDSYTSNMSIDPKSFLKNTNPTKDTPLYTSRKAQQFHLPHISKVSKLYMHTIQTLANQPEYYHSAPSLKVQNKICYPEYQLLDTLQFQNDYKDTKKQQSHYKQQNMKKCKLVLKNCGLLMDKPKIKKYSKYLHVR